MFLEDVEKSKVGSLNQISSPLFRSNFDSSNAFFKILFTIGKFIEPIKKGELTNISKNRILLSYLY